MLTPLTLKYQYSQCGDVSLLPTRSHLRGGVLNMSEHLNVLLRHVISRHGRKVGLRLLLHAQFPVVACRRYNNTTSTQQMTHPHLGRLKQPWLNNLINSFYANVLILRVLLLSLFEAVSLWNFIMYHLCMFM